MKRVFNIYWSRKFVAAGVMIFIVMLGLLLFPLPARAVPLTNTNISGAYLTGLIAGGSAAGPLTSTFDYSPVTAGGDGDVTSQVFIGAGDAAGLFVYTYQIEHYFGSSEVEVGGISFDFTTDPTLTPVGAGITSFYVGSGGSGSVATTYADGTLGTVSFGGSPPVPWIAPGLTSYIFGTFSPNMPEIVVADVLDTGSTIASASVYTPDPTSNFTVPEPTTLLLLGSGLLGLGVLGRKRMRKD